MNKIVLMFSILCSGAAFAETNCEPNKSCGSKVIVHETPCGVRSTKVISVCVPECNSCSACCE